MATGFPTKTTFANGNTLSASDLNDITGSLNLIIPATTTDLSWQTWTPTVGGGWAQGNGTFQGNHYTQIGKTVIAAVQFTVGSTTTKGTVLTFALPVTARFGQGQSFTCRMSVAGTTYYGAAAINSTTAVTIAALNASGTYLTSSGISSSVPNSWATSDTVQFVLVYEAA